MPSYLGRSVALLAALVLSPPVAAVAQHNSARNVIPANGRDASTGPARLYGWPVTVSGLNGVIDDLRITLHNLRHPCPQDLDILLVGPSGLAVPLLSDGGGCSGGTTPVTITFSQNAILNPTSSLSDGAVYSRYDGADSDGPDTWPAPAPAPNGASLFDFDGLGPNGTWTLYIVDDRAGNVGTIDGWTMSFQILQTRSNINSISIPVVGAATPYPSTIAVSGVIGRLLNVKVRVKGLTHQYPDDIDVLLVGPGGEKVLLMSDTGGSNVISSAVTLTFDDSGSTLPDVAAITTGTYKPTNYDTITDVLPAPAPAAPFGSSLGVFDGSIASGDWKLYVRDDSNGQFGTIQNGWELEFLSESSAFDSIFDIQVIAPVTATSPFYTFPAGSPSGETKGLYSWRNTTTNQSGLAEQTGPQSFLMTVPMQAGANQIRFDFFNASGTRSTANYTVQANQFTYSFSEGATGPFFDLDLGLANPNNAAMPLSVTFLTPSGPLGPKAYSLPAQQQLRINVEALAGEFPALANTAVSTVIQSTSALPLGTERAMFWDASYYGGHAGSAVDGASTTWYFAEGSQGFFDTFVLLANSNAVAATVNVKFLVEGGAPVTKTYNVLANTRQNVWAAEIPELAGKSFGIEVTSNQPIIAERAMYFPVSGGRTFEGGHESAGVTRLSKNWFFAEGATGSFFDTYILLSNPTASSATVTFTYRTDGGSVVNDTRTVPANSRLTVNVEDVPGLANVAVSTSVSSDVPIVAERAMYWSGPFTNWYEAHNSFGVTELGEKWVIADGREGGTQGYETYILLVNPETVPADVKLTFLRPGQAAVTKTITVNANTRRNVTLPSDAPDVIGAGTTEFGVVIETTNKTRIAVERATYWNSGGQIWAGGANVTGTRLP